MASDSQPLPDRSRSANAALMHGRGQPDSTTYDSNDEGCFPEAPALEDAMENSEDCIALVDLHGQFVYMNLPGMWQMEIEGQTPKVEWSQLWPQEYADLAEYSLESARCGRRTRFTAHRLTARGSTRWWDVAVSPIFDKRGEPQQMFCIFRDITDLKKIESSLRDSLAAREILLLEVNHRIKNSLAGVAGLLAAQASCTKDEFVRSCLKQAQSRVVLVAQIHRRLYETGAHEQVDVGDYIAEVARGTIITLSAEHRILLHTECERGLPVPADHALSLALIVSELITNCVKHAFNNRDGKVHMTLQATISHVELKVDDDGKGLSASFTPQSSSGMGMRIVLLLVHQLHGELLLDRVKPGAHFRIILPRDDRATTEPSS